MKMPKCVFPQYRAIIAVFVLLIIAVPGFTQVFQDEMRDLPPVNFINYEGPHARVDTREEIRQIGVGLGQQIAARERGIQPTLEAMTYEQRLTHSYRFETGATNRYFVIHCVSGPEDNKLNADILGLGVDVGVDHIRNLRVIIQGYLQSAYDYSASDALLLAEFITIYNAVYRGNWDYFTGRFKTQVISHLTRERAGLSIRYDQWPGRTLILIPLGQGLGSIDTASITDRRVIEEMRREDDQGVPQRQQIVNIMERETEQAQRQVQQDRQAIRQEQGRVTEDRRQVEQERRQIEQERTRTRERQQAGRITDEEARVIQEELDKREDELEKQEDDLARREEEIDQRRRDADRREQLAEERADESQRQREEIARDQQAVIVQQVTGGVIGVTIERQNPTMGRIVRVNPANGEELRRSPLDLIYSRTVNIIGGRIIAIAGENRGAGAVRLIEVNQINLEMAKQGDDDIKPGSLIWVNGNDLYALTIDLRNNHCYLGRFDTNLVMQAKSTVRIHPEASVIIQQGRLLTQRENGHVLLLNPADLTEIKD